MSFDVVIPALPDRFANPFILCVEPSCQRRVTNVGYPGGINIPCGHKGTHNVCPSWGPVDGCECAASGLPPHGPARDPNINEAPGSQP